jgi:hypothetical protein
VPGEAVVKWLLLLLALAGCDYEGRAVRDLRYYRDTRTGMCYAAAYVNVAGDASVALTWVPCEKVPTSLLQDVSQ